MTESAGLRPKYDTAIPAMSYGQIKNGTLSNRNVKKLLSESLKGLKTKIDNAMIKCDVFFLDVTRTTSKKTTAYRDQELRDYFNFSWKSSLPSLHTEEKDIASRYSGGSWQRNTSRSLDIAKRFESTVPVEQRQEVQTIVQHRKILAEMTQIISSQKIQQSVKEIQKRCESLSDPSSQDIVKVPDAYTCFTIPGGCRGHAVTYEFQRDSAGQYYFVIHNKGLGTEDVEIHGNTILTDENREYERTTVTIKVSKEQIQNPQFLTALLVHREISPNMKEPYSTIKKYLSTGDPPKLDIVVSPAEQKYRAICDEIDKIEDKIDSVSKTSGNEKELNELYGDVNKLQDQLHVLKKDIIENDPGFHTTQTFGTCSESCLTGPEKGMAGPDVRRELKLATIHILVDDLRQAKLSTPQAQLDRDTMVRHSEERIKKIQVK